MLCTTNIDLSRAELRQTEEVKFAVDALFCVAASPCCTHNVVTRATGITLNGDVRSKKTTTRAIYYIQVFTD